MSGTIRWSEGLPEVLGPDGVRVDATTDWVPLLEESVLPAYNQLVVDLLEIAEGRSGVLYWDTADPPRPTIGTGANLEEDNGAVREAVLTAMDLVDREGNGRNYRRQVTDAIDRFVTAKDYSDGLRVELNRIMALAYADPQRAAKRPTFTLEPEEMRPALLQTIIAAGIESEIDGAFDPDVPISIERAVLASLQFNSTAGPRLRLLGDDLSDAVNGGDRAAAWFEIRYRSNRTLDPGAQNRRVFESELFGLYDRDLPQTESGVPMVPVEAAPGRACRQVADRHRGCE